MSLSLDTVFQVAEVVQKAVEIYQRIHDAPETIRKLGRRMERLRTILVNLEEHLRSNSKHALARLRPAQTKDLLGIVDDTREDCGKVYAIFEKWEKKIGPLALQFRGNAVAQYVAQAYFALGSNAKDLESIAADIDLHRRDIDGYLGLMGVQGIQANQDELQKMKREIKNDLQTLHQLLEAQAKLKSSQLTPSAQMLGPKKNKMDQSVKPRLSPSPTPPRKDFRIIFVDPHNIGRSVCAEVLMGLYRSWTLKAGGSWRVATIHSAGFFCKNGNDCVEVLDKLDYKHESDKVGMSTGSKRPIAAAAAAIFDNKSFNEVAEQKKQLKAETASRTSRGTKKEIFKNYDYIIVFTGREHDNMIKLRSAIRASEGKEAAPKAKGRVIQLGQYISADGIVEEILDPPKNPDGSHKRDDWNKKVAQLKIAIRGFLRREMDWSTPENAAKKTS